MVRNNFALVGILLGCSMTLATTVVPARALFKVDSDRTATLSPPPQKSLTIAQTEVAPTSEQQQVEPVPDQQQATPIPDQQQVAPIQVEPIPEQQQATPTPDQQQVAPTPGEPVIEVHSVDWYKQQVGLSKSAELGEERWFDDFCEVRAYQGAVTLNRGITENRVCQQDIPGWQIIGHKIEVIENKNNRGSWRANVIAKDGNFVANEQEIGSKFAAAITLAVKYKDIEAKKGLELEYQRNSQLIRSYSSNKNSLELKATANGGAFSKSIIHIKAKVKMIRLR